MGEREDGDVEKKRSGGERVFRLEMEIYGVDLEKRVEARKQGERDFDADLM